MSLYLSSMYALRSSLFIATRSDIASVNIAKHLLKSFSWQKVPLPSDEPLPSIDSIDEVVEESAEVKKPLVYRCSRWLRGGESGSRLSPPSLFHYFMIVNEPVLHMNNIEQIFHHVWSEEMDSCATSSLPAIDDIVFVSRHAAASGTLSLTVHPIGVPWLSTLTSSGGIPGRCSPPSPHIGPLFRLLLHETRDRGLDRRFAVSLEATHHGPYSSLPCCFVEIGSSANEWADEQAGAVWAHCLGEYFQLTKRVEGEAVGGDGDDLVVVEQVVEDMGLVVSGLAVMVIGGGHYVPKLNDMLKWGSHIHAGHALASYTLEEHFQTLQSQPENKKWKEVILEAIASTRVTYPHCQLICLVDKKAFTAEARKLIVSLLEANQVSWSFKTTDIKKISDTYCKNQGSATSSAKLSATSDIGEGESEEVKVDQLV